MTPVNRSFGPFPWVMTHRLRTTVLKLGAKINLSSSALFLFGILLQYRKSNTFYDKSKTEESKAPHLRDLGKAGAENCIQAVRVLGSGHSPINPMPMAWSSAVIEVRVRVVWCSECSHTLISFGMTCSAYKGFLFIIYLGLLIKS